MFQTFHNSKFDIILLQEHMVLMKTLFFERKTRQVTRFFSSLDRSKSGAAILCKESKNFKVEFENSDKAGRIILVTVETQKTNFRKQKYMLPIYRLHPHPPAENLLWQTEILCHTHEVILGGDFNMVEHLTMHRQRGNPNRQHQQGLEELNEIKQICNLIDIWRTQNKFKTKFTYKNDILDFKSRIDCFIFGTRRGKNIVSDCTQYFTRSSHEKFVFEKYIDKQEVLRTGS